MPRTAFAGTGFYVPDRVVKNDELTQYMDTSDEWIIERTGIQERRWVTDGMTSAEMACRASKMAISAAGIEPGEIDAIVLGTLSPDVFFPGTGGFLQRDLGLEGIPALDVRAQCSGFVYGLSVAGAWIKSGQYRAILLVGVEIHSTGIDVSTRGRDLAVPGLGTNLEPADKAAAAGRQWFGHHDRRSAYRTRIKQALNQRFGHIASTYETYLVQPFRHQYCFSLA